ncbi:MAG TPA: TolC family protein [Pseudolabrys sp.]|nr:TolC family protein [Pseudolabrys sp.]
MQRRLHTLAPIATALLLSACASFSPDGGMSVTADIAGRGLHKNVVAIRDADDAAAVRAEVAHLLKRPLTADAAVQVALINNRGLQAAYNELGIADAVRVRQSLPPNPSIDIVRVAGGGQSEFDGQIVASILALATLPARSDIAADRFRHSQLAAALATLRLAAETRRAYYRAVAAQQLVGLLEQANDASATAAKLAKRLGESGALNKLDQAREQAFHAELAAQLATARLRAATERERLIRALGLWGGDLAFKIPDRLPPLPKRAPALRAVEQTAVSHRVDLQMARIELAALAKSYGLTNATRFINVLDAGYANKITTDGGGTVHEHGFAVAFEVPIFDFGETRLREAEQTYMQALNRLAQKAIDVRSQAREAYRTYRAAYDIAGHYQREVLPLRQIVSDEMMLHYGAMQVDVFALLTEARQKTAANVSTVEALRDFWLASSDLSAVLIGGDPAGASEAAAIAMPASGEASGH